MISTSFASNSYSVGQTRGQSKVLVGSNALHFGRASSTGSKTEDKPTRIPETEAGLLSRIGSRLTQFFKDIANAFGHLFSWRSAKDEVKRSGAEFLERPEIKPIFAFMIRDAQKEQEQKKRTLDWYKEHYPNDYQIQDGYKEANAEHQQIIAIQKPEGFAQEAVDGLSKEYDKYLTAKAAEKKHKAHSGSSSCRDNCC